MFLTNKKSYLLSYITSVKCSELELMYQELRYRKIDFVVSKNKRFIYMYIKNELYKIHPQSIKMIPLCYFINPLNVVPLNKIESFFDDSSEPLSFNFVTQFNNSSVKFITHSLKNILYLINAHNKPISNNSKTQP